MRYAELADRPKTQYHQPHTSHPNGQFQRQSFRHPRTALGASGHWLHLLSVAAPLVIGELIKDPDKKWRALRLASVGGAILSEALWTVRLSKDRRKDEESSAALDECHERCR